MILFWPPIYYASGAVVIGNQEPASGNTPAAWIEKLGDPADLESQLLIVLSRRMLRLALTRPGVIEAVLEECKYRSALANPLIRSVNCAKMEPDSNELLDYVQARYTVAGAGRSRIITIGYRSPLPEVAFILANALLISYLEDQRGENSRSREASASWLLKQAKTFDAVRGREAGGPLGALTQSRQKFYQDLYNKATDLETERRNLVNAGRLVSLAEVPRVPYFPKPVPLLAGGIMIAAILATLAALRRDTGDQTVRRTRDSSSLTLEPVLACLPLERHSSGNRMQGLKSPLRWVSPPENEAALFRAIAAGAHDPLVAGAARSLHARLLLAGDNKARRCILVSSAGPGEGKTFTVTALARAAIESGRRVLVIECNLCRPVAAARPGSSAAGGLAGILRGEIEAHEAVIQTPLPGLEFIGSGSVRGDSTMLLIDGQLTKLMRYADQYDLVLLDGPAAGFLPDAVILARHADGVLWCARWGHTLQSDVKAALDDLRKQRVTLFGLVVTMVRRGELRYYERPHPLSPRSAEEV